MQLYDHPYVNTVVVNMQPQESEPRSVITMKNESKRAASKMEQAAAAGSRIAVLICYKLAESIVIVS